ncbi:glutaredoxin [Methanosarcina sp. 2.H.T.1A.6]|uniref:thioredoxin family protein n=1 Tax=unclassified Methanosarcina TaxID=2644672 RepID=UPI000622113F|nr:MULTISPECIES: thioredoxin family protein [unclassified Methanosarcina]KKG14321.1 glutaredoxin [Methanosarcina sp. 2.H.T.1A.3]KKG19811.1 glutaredoxin [Methanosarcina sp. 2.H.T.1A.6]KKG27194.1 glutaredoxin [Methanosarcina sp. 2.H.T.1A.8]KKG28919.1 glutaredoxin [Methanosarcina sp. 2.H.T.1A.15]
MRIEVLGSGCAKCNKTKEIAEKAVKEMGVEAEIIKVEDFDKILGYGVMITPALVIDGDVKVAGKVPSIDDIKKWITK